MLHFKKEWLACQTEAAKGFCKRADVKARIIQEKQEKQSQIASASSTVLQYA